MVGAVASCGGCRRCCRPSAVCAEGFVERSVCAMDGAHVRSRFKPNQSTYPLAFLLFVGIVFVIIVPLQHRPDEERGHRVVQGRGVAVVRCFCCRCC